MPSRLVICKDKQEALEMQAAGLLMLRLGYGDENWQPAEYFPGFSVKVKYGRGLWSAKEFGYYVEE